jgi:hypothetical protein
MNNFVIFTIFVKENEAMKKPLVRYSFACIKKTFIKLLVKVFLSPYHPSSPFERERIDTFARGNPLRFFHKFN